MSCATPRAPCCSSRATPTSRSFPNDPPLGFSTTDRVRAFTASGVKGTIFVTTVEDLAHRRSAVWRSVAALIWPLLALAPTIVAAVWISVRLAFRPVDRFRGELADRGRGNLTPVAASGLPEEITPVAASVNALIGRLRDALEAERGFAANSAHELRTPIAAALAQSQRLIAELPEGAPRQRAAAVASALRRLTRLSEKLLQLAKAEGGGLIATTARPLAPVLRLVAEDVDRDLDLGGRLELALPDGDAALSDLDPDAFAVLARNLIENAVKHGDPERADRGAARHRPLLRRQSRADRTARAAAPIDTTVRARADARGRLGARARDRLGDLSRRRPDA